MTKIVETYLLDGNNASNIPLPHDCEIKSIREDDDYLIIDFENDISYHDATVIGNFDFDHAVFLSYVGKFW